MGRGLGFESVSDILSNIRCDLNIRNLVVEVAIKMPESGGKLFRELL